ncbi:hypothetical protein NSQ59_27415 [Margalitia sp. FSL K6-0131]|uniref:hypothetical protein n=1 Tax=Margalitia sp. FSL K6-0131 TaxID=2954604 RepID=UPI0030F5AADE
MKKRISASEINEFCYCPYSWLYSRKYGKKHFQMDKQKVMQRGTSYHQKHQDKMISQGPVSWKIIFLVLMILIVLVSVLVVII